MKHMVLDTCIDNFINAANDREVIGDCRAWVCWLRLTVDHAIRDFFRCLNIGAETFSVQVILVLVSPRRTLCQVAFDLA